MSVAKILVVEDDPALQEALVDILTLNELEVTAVSSAEEALVALDDDIAMVFSDIRMDGMDGYSLMKRIRALKPYLPIVLMTAYGTIEQAVDAMKSGAVDYMVKPFEADVLVQKARAYFNRDASLDDDFVVADSASVQIKNMANRVAKSTANVMITGESGTGKEVLARYIHQQSDRKDQAFVAINCAAIPDNMLEAVLFGYEKGAFTGALKSMPGKFEQANKGTIFLDEIGEMRVDLQAKLLRVLQEREVERIGSLQTISLDIRVISASNINMKQAIAEGRFREDLFYRLNVFPLHLPALRQRPKDIQHIANKLLIRHSVSSCARPELTECAMARLISHDWPGNIRELDNVIQRALVMITGDEISASNIIFDDGLASNEASVEVFNGQIKEQRVIESGELTSSDDVTLDLKARETELILSVLKRNNGHRQKTAEDLNLSPRTLRYKLAKLKDQGIDV
ncbi:sigma-54-dependent Fis family transcriptional regulator [Thiomicrospira microaerophila]|uniref:sigma-54-dependent transcriptional regulator n=1 Tax=Thiomicrospira microaerophila TaxID=406020 RepID=UPI00200C07E8|nr:sigma-54 dependent transcriptional regulator [Thiomicrospira microaerophila]UQB41689.1 sigma-54-dependent Fis family transcriptional regulator [Thiomicrospira microaerophila]